MFKTGDIVICLRDFSRMDFIDIGYWGGVVDHPIPKKTYIVRSGTDHCGCGARILLQEIQIVSKAINLQCQKCKQTHIFPEVGYPKEIFAKLCDNPAYSEEVEKELKKLEHEVNVLDKKSVLTKIKEFLV